VTAKLFSPNTSSSLPNVLGVSASSQPSSRTLNGSSSSRDGG
jgi:hypothetical protein